MTEGFVIQDLKGVRSCPVTWARNGSPVYLLVCCEYMLEIECVNFGWVLLGSGEKGGE